VARHPRRAGGRREQGRQHADERRLARAVGPEEAVSLSGSDRKRDGVVREDAVEPLGEVLDFDGIHGLGLVIPRSEATRNLILEATDPSLRSG
jgi:hypothetical protein